MRRMAPPAETPPLSLHERNIAHHHQATSPSGLLHAVPDERMQRPARVWIDDVAMTADFLAVGAIQPVDPVVSVQSIRIGRRLDGNQLFARMAWAIAAERGVGAWRRIPGKGIVPIA